MSENISVKIEAFLVKNRDISISVRVIEYKIVTVDLKYIYPESCAMVLILFDEVLQRN